jgi:hypothetical protein
MRFDPLEMRDIANTVGPEEIEKIKLEIGIWKKKQDQYVNQQGSGPNRD